MDAKKMVLKASLREDTHKKKWFYSGRTTIRGKGGSTPLTTKQKTPGCFSPKIGKKKKKCQNPFQDTI